MEISKKASNSCREFFCISIPTSLEQEQTKERGLKLLFIGILLLRIIYSIGALVFSFYSILHKKYIWSIVPNAVIMAVCIWMLARSKASLKAKKICALIIYYVGLLCDVETSFNLATDSHFYMAILSYSPITAIIQSYAIEKMYISHTLLCGQALYFSLRLAFSKVTIPEEIAFFFAVFISHVCIGFASYIVILERTIKNNFNTEINETLDGWKETMNICPIGFLIMVENQAVYSNIEMGHIFNSFKTQESSSYLSILQMLEKIAKPMNSIGIHGIEIKIINLESKIFEWRKKKVFYKLKEAEMHVLIDVTAASNREKMSTQKKYVEMLVATSTHELRTPLNGIKSFLTITKSHCTPEGLSYISKALSACELQESLINDIMDFAKIQGDNVIINNDQINSHQLLHDCYNILEFQTKEKSLQFDLNINPSVPVIFNSDGRRIKQILLNLLSNALKFTSNGYIKLKAKKKGNMIGFSVKDSGIGIKEEDIGKLFKPFGIIDSSLPMNKMGTGLGLNLCKVLSQRLGGDIKVKSTFGVGTKFTFCALVSTDSLQIPFKKFDKSKSIENQQPTIEPDNSKLLLTTGKTFLSFNSKLRSKIFLVDDIPLNITVASKLFQMLGHQSFKAFSGKDAIEQIKKVHLEIKIAFIDLNMPNMDGFELCGHLINMMKDKTISKFPLVALTGEDRNDVLSVCQAKGFIDVAMKPLSLDYIKVLLKKFEQCD